MTINSATFGARTKIINYDTSLIKDSTNLKQLLNNEPQNIQIITNDINALKPLQNEFKGKIHFANPKEHRGQNFMLALTNKHAKKFWEKLTDITVPLDLSVWLNQTDKEDQLESSFQKLLIKTMSTEKFETIDMSQKS